MKSLMIAANWKMNKTSDEAKQTAKELAKLFKKGLPEGREVVIFPPFTSLKAARKGLKETAGFSLGAQNFYPAEKGAFTGEISPEMLIDQGCLYALTGHSERRHVLGESSEFVGRKTGFGLKAGLKIVLCVGETKDEREAGKLAAVLEEQMSAGLAEVSAEVTPESLVLAYEPVWAIGTGLVAGPMEIVEAHGLVRAGLTKRFGEAKACEIKILYGGSVTPENSSEILALDNVDGVLVGGASLRAEGFSKIISA